MKNLISVLADQKIVTISQSDFVAKIKDFKRSCMVNIIYLVDDTRSKTKSGKKSVQKLVQVVRVYLNHDYKKKVEKLTEQIFVPLPRKGKIVITNTIVKSIKSGALMLSGKILANDNCRNTIAIFTKEGKKITHKEGEILDLWTNSYYNPKPKKTAGRGTVAKKDDFHFCEPYIKNLKFVKFLGTWYKIV
tara:strand:- start:27 stop:596 length:570 start_codon:yes stop_codon:yes gene_type:complete